MPDIWALMRAIRRSSLTAPERHTLLTLTSLVDPRTGLIPDRFQPSLTDLTRHTGLGRSTIVRALNATEEGGWIKRTVPTKKAAQKNKEKTSYLLVIPAGALTEDEESDPVGTEEASATAGLVPERDQLEGWSQSGTSATAGLGLVPQRDQASATAGHKYLNHVYQGEPLPPPTEGERAQLAIAVASGPTTPAPAAATPAQRKRMSRVITKKPERLPDDWHVSDEMIEWARENTPNIGRFATDKFIDHFAGGGPKKLKKDWDATWRNWMRSDQERFEERNGYRGEQPTNPSSNTMAVLDDNGRRAGGLDRSLIRSPADQRIADAMPLYEKYRAQELAEQENTRG